MKLSLHDRAFLLTIIPQKANFIDHLCYKELAELIHLSDSEISEIKRVDKNNKCAYHDKFKEPKEFAIKPEHVITLNHHLDKLDKECNIDASLLNSYMLVKQILIQFKDEGVLPK